MTAVPVGVLVGVALALASLVLGLSVHREVPGIDRELHLVATELDPNVTHAAAVVSFVLSPGLATIALLSLALRALLAKDALLLRAAVLLGVSWCTVLARYGYRRVRPVEHPQWSYPSGHVTAVTAVAFTGVVLVGRLAHRYLRHAIALAATAVVLIAAGRVALEVHWFTDTVGAVLATTGVGLVAAHALRLLPLGVVSRREQS
ncbi:phosphatase PAP2 family protein [Saccharothrix syringae]|uniref:Phosphatase PAP2 family protein n=1 Tax=Saccharothrix syringae TaxID=103733 RepID=A0A5Q0GV66_SACSY|nr:phosphatase PAP2 family protein [Saccharothrix syringae]QFZ17394.1 phosphatase PAP2 family protein [Saccharothrix syringae]